MDRNARVLRAAGILEGEGSFMTKTNGHAPRISCQMTDEDVIHELADLFGGSISEYLPINPNHKKSWTWNLIGDKAAATMLEIRPYMFARRKARMDEVLKIWRDRQEVVKTTSSRLDAAAAAYLAGEGTMREVAKRFGTSYSSIWRRTAVKNK